ncbi:TonB-dependent receptor domain-containing protein [Gallaecimonas sp. GXIMD1310]|uniref:TonB-dependent receptor domain-containing protein n=1 Tax=Gallaecimonas sp. GXIMD1310 TaxID=3131926 RepID=UPI0032559807
MAKGIAVPFGLSLVFLAVAPQLHAAEKKAEKPAAQQNKKQDGGLNFEQIVVTGSAIRNQTVMDSSVSVSTLTPTDLKAPSPRSTAEIFRSIPGIRSESTGGEGNANIAVRGLPVASGGAKFLLLEEDGLPVLQFGDISFGNADIFLRADANVKRIEAIRGGSASTTASNSPGGIINFISKTGEDEGGSIATTFGLDYNTFRTDFDYGGRLSDDMRFHIGGFYRTGEGPRKAGYDANQGGQIKANFTKEYDKGFVRLYLKYLDDKAIGYLPMPMQANGKSLPGFNSQKDALQSAYFLSTAGLGGANQPRTGDMRDGMHPKMAAIGFEANFDLGNNWNVVNRFRHSSASGTFMSPFPAEVATSSALAASIGGNGAYLQYANGPQAGQNYNGQYALRIHSFDVNIDDLGSNVNDLKLTKDLGNSSLTMGYYKATQNIAMSWLWNSYVMELKGDNAALLNVLGANGTSYSDNGLYAYGVPYWGNLQRHYNVQYDISAPYAAFASQLGNLSLDASVRVDTGHADGYYFNPTTETYDVNGDGQISIPEQNVAALDLSHPGPVNYGWHYTSYSAGANYQFSSDLATFARISHGGRANADRLLYGKVRADGSVARQDAVDEVDQYELGVKWRHDNLSLFATGFYAKTQEQNYEATTQKFFDRQYKAKGIELESSYHYGSFNLHGGLTYTNAEISKDALDPSVVGHTPRRQAKFIYNLTAAYDMDSASVGVNLIGTTSAYAQDVNDLKFGAYTQVNGFATYYLSDQLSVSLNVNNLFNAVGLTEAEEGSVPANGIIRARAINGRTTSMTLAYRF